jgi:hypothetical protein
VPRAHLEVVVVVEDRGVLADRDGGDEAIHQLADGGAPVSTDTVEGGRRLEVGEAAEGEPGEGEQATKGYSAGSRRGTAPLAWVGRPRLTAAQGRIIQAVRKRAFTCNQGSNLGRRPT